MYKRIAGGKIAVSLPVAAGDFYKSFLGEKLQDLEIARAEISLTEKLPLIFSAGYSVQRNKSEWAAAAEYAKNGKGKLSAKWHLEF
ncbi:MAG: hypothetical protein HAW59_03440 [Betaproteobacteria bacterium]|nr:hypothetical protein [Betaproteobacteria bacterium]